MEEVDGENGFRNARFLSKMLVLAFPHVNLFMQNILLRLSHRAGGVND